MVVAGAGLRQVEPRHAAEREGPLPHAGTFMAEDAANP